LVIECRLAKDGELILGSTKALGLHEIEGSLLLTYIEY